MFSFYKYHGAGNDFILVDQRFHQLLRRSDTEQIAHLCDRKFGIGADGLILLQHHSVLPIEMVYFNADGRESTLCGNGGRCFAAFVKHLGIASEEIHFLAVDGPHVAHIAPNPVQNGLEWVELQMNPVHTLEQTKELDYILDTGSPHYVRFDHQVLKKNMVEVGRSVRYNDRFEAVGINVNLVETTIDGSLIIRTYERGVEDETLACGTGITAAALAYARLQHRLGPQEIPVKALGGHLSVRFIAEADGSFSDIWLCGPAQRVFKGELLNGEW
jgi:diaminopimelate epimerase